MIPPSRVPFLALAALLAVLPMPERASGEDVLQPWQVAVLESVAEPRLSPDGTRIAFLRVRPRRPLEEESGPHWQELHLVDAAGDVRPFVAGAVTVRAPRWRNDHEISFLAKRDGDEHQALYLISTRGGEARRLLQHETDISAYSWSADGRRVAFLAREGQSEERKKLEEQGFDARIYEEDDPFTRLFVVELSEGVTEEDAKPTRVQVEGSLRSVAFASDGERLLVGVTPTPLIDDSYHAHRLRVIDLDGEVLASVDTPGKLGESAWSPDGERIALVAAADAHDTAAGRLMVVPASGGRPRELLPGLEGHVAHLGWRDESTLVYVADIGTETRIGEVGVDGAEGPVLVAAGKVVAGSVQVRAGRAALVAETPGHPPEIYGLELEERELRRRTHGNEWLDEVRLARQETVGFTARDGLALEGVLIHPLDREAGKRYPLILVVHGGPESHYSNGWLTGYSQLGQLAAARGFAVFYPNYRGSTGRGVDFARTSQGAAAAAEFDDLVDAVDHLVATGLVDRDRVGITGGSYGGYASAWATTYYSERFAAAIPFVGISDNVSKVGTTDIPREMNLVHHRRWLWEDWEYFLRSSPIRYVERNRTPTLILHGAEDPRVHPGQSLELYRHLEVLGQAPVRLVLYPGEGHGNRRSAARFDYLLRTLRWMEHYLQGPGGEPPPHEIDYAAHLPWGAESDSVAEETR